MADRQDPKALFHDNLRLIDRIVASLCRRNGLTGDDADDFRSWVHVRMLDNDYAILRKFREESSLGTYLTIVISMLLREYRVKEWGRWRPSAAAQRLGPVGVWLERLVYRDRHTLAEAAQVLRDRHGVTLTDRELAEMLAKIPPRRPPGPPEVGSEALAATPAPERADDRVTGEEAERRRRWIQEALLQCLDGLSGEDRMIVKMRFWESMSVADVSRALNLPQKPLYRRLERAFKSLRKCLEARGISRDELRGLPDDGGGEPD